MNEFEKRMNALRLQFRDERVQITKNCNRTIGRLNTAIGTVKAIEAREALRAEKARVYEAARRSMKYSRLCYLQQLEALEDEYSRHLEKHPSGRHVRRLMERLCMGPKPAASSPSPSVSARTVGRHFSSPDSLSLLKAPYCTSKARRDGAPCLSFVPLRLSTTFVAWQQSKSPSTARPPS